MFPDGICRVTDNYYTKTIQFQDINYQLAQQEDQTAIFEEWCSFLNFFDSSIRFELSFMNMATDASNFEKMVRIPYQKDSHFNPVRTEYSTMLRRQLAQGNNGLTKTKYLTFGIEAGIHGNSKAEAHSHGAGQKVHQSSPLTVLRVVHCHSSRSPSCRRAWPLPENCARDCPAAV